MVFNFIGNNFVRLYCDSCHISVHLKKNLIKIGEFLCSYFNIEDGKNMQHFWHIISRKVETQLNAKKKKKICAVYGEGAVTDQTGQKWFVKFRTGDVLLDDAP